MLQMMIPDIVSEPSVTLRPAPINPAWIISGSPIATSAEVFRSQDGTAATYVWACTSGEFDWTYDIDETLVILDGGMILDKGLPTEKHAKAGDLVFFPAGTKARWLVESHVRKVAFMRKALPEAVVTLISARRTARKQIRSLQNWASGRPQEQESSSLL